MKRNNYRKSFMILLGILVFSAAAFADKGKKGNIKKSDLTKNFKNKVSYCIGMDIGDNLKQQSIDVDIDILFYGIKNALSGKDDLLSEEEIKATMKELQKKMKNKYEEERKKSGEKNLKESEKFLTKNKKKKGVITLKSGLQYKVLKKGTGDSPTSDDIVSVNYKGTFINGEEFDSSYKNGKPVTFPVSGVIKGWTEALPLMKTGGKWELYISPDLAYGKRGAGNDIGPNTLLIFTLELISIEDKKAKDEK